MITRRITTLYATVALCLPGGAPPVTDALNDHAGWMSAVCAEHTSGLDETALPPPQGYATLYACGRGLKNGTKVTLLGIRDFAVWMLTDLPEETYKALSASVEPRATRPLPTSLKDFPRMASDQTRVASEQEQELARQYFRAYEQFLEAATQAASRAIEGFSCLPPEQKAELICSGGVQAAFFAVTPAQVIKGVRWSAEVGPELARLMSTIKNVRGAENLTTAQTLERLTYQIKKLEQTGHVVRKTDGFVLSKVENAIGSETLVLNQQIRLPSGAITWEPHLVSIDRTTSAINGKDKAVGDFLTKLSQQSGGNTSVVFIDVNDLKNVNYFEGGTAVGDAYLGGVGQAVRASIRPDDLFVRMGGDELVVLVNSSDPQVVQTVVSRINTAVTQNPQAREAFRAQSQALAQTYREINTATDLGSLPRSVRANLSDSERALATKNFSELKSTLLTRQRELIRDKATLQPSVSLGSTSIASGESFADALARADRQAGEVKAAYKEAIGRGSSKYGTRGSAPDTRPSLKAKPEARPPVPAPSAPRLPPDAN